MIQMKNFQNDSTPAGNIWSQYLNTRLCNPACWWPGGWATQRAACQHNSLVMAKYDAAPTQHTTLEHPNQRQNWPLFGLLVSIGLG